MCIVFLVLRAVYEPPTDEYTVHYIVTGRNTTKYGETISTSNPDLNDTPHVILSLDLVVEIPLGWENELGIPYFQLIVIDI